MHAIVGVCLIRMERLRPQGVPSAFGLSSENMAHRVAIRYPGKDGMRPGVFIWSRETDQRWVELLGGRLFPGVHRHARFQVDEGEDRLAMEVTATVAKPTCTFQPAFRKHGSLRQALAHLMRYRNSSAKATVGFPVRWAAMS